MSDDDDFLDSLDFENIWGEDDIHASADEKDAEQKIIELSDLSGPESIPMAHEGSVENSRKSDPAPEPDKDKNLSSEATQKRADEVPLEAGKNDGENSSEKATLKDGSDVEPAPDEAFSKAFKRGDERDMHDEFERFEKAHSHDDSKMRKKRYDLEQQLHQVDLSERKKFRYYIAPLIDQYIEAIAEHLGENKGTVVNTAVLLLYRNCFCDEKKSVSDLGILLDNFSLQIQELSIYADNFENLAYQSVLAEMSPLNMENPDSAEEDGHG